MKIPEIIFNFGITLYIKNATKDEESPQAPDHLKLAGRCGTPGMIVEMRFPVIWQVIFHRVAARQEIFLRISW